MENPPKFLLIMNSALRRIKAADKRKLIMRVNLIIVLMTTFLMQVGAAGYAQKITLNEKNTSLVNVIDKIRAQTGYDFVFNFKEVENAKKVTANLKNVDLQEALSLVFKDQNLTYSVKDNFIVLKPREVTFFDRVASVFTNVDLRGRVLDEEGNPLIGATVRVKGTNRSVQTNSRGEFNLSGVQAEAIIIVTYVGCTPQELKVPSGNTSDMRIVMKIDVNKLEEVGVTVNTGYQRIKPEQSTGAVSQIGTKAYESRISANFLDGLVNRLPGLMINNSVSFTSTAPGAGSSSSRALFNIRGISTMSANQNPLIVVDGYPTELTLNMIDPNEIKSVTVLKDAAAATVYGVRASNGVIVIERKQAAIGKPAFTFNATAGLRPKENYSRYRVAKDASSIVTNYQRELFGKSIDADRWRLLSTIGSNFSSSFTPVYYLLAQSKAKIITPDQAEAAYAALEGYDNSEDYSRLFLRSAITQTYNLNASGGNENALYYITANYTGTRQGTIENNDNRISLSARTTLKLSRRMSLELTTDYQEERNNGAPVPDINDLLPFERLQDVNGNPVAVGRGSSVNPFYANTLLSKGMEDALYYPLIDVNEITDRTRTVNNRITANFVYNLGRGFGLSFGGIYETSRADSRYYASELSSRAKQDVNAYVSQNPDGTLKYNLPKGGYLRQEASSNSGYTVRAQLNYNKTIAGDHSFNGILGTEVRDVVAKSNLSSYFGYSDQTLLQQPVDYAGIASGTVRSSFSLSSPYINDYSSLFNQKYAEDRFLSAYANMVYSFRNTYSLTGSLRIDQSNLFGTNPKYKYKPLWSIGAAWNIDKEEFMQEVAWVNRLKLRGAYGFNGNVAKLSLPQAIGQYILNTGTSPNSTALRLLSYANSSLRWEETRNINLGLDYHIFKTVRGSVDWYRKKSKDLLGNSLIDPTIGVSPSIINKATINNNGVEVSLNADWIARKDVNWNTGLVLARNTSMVTDVYQQANFNPSQSSVLGYVKGYPVGALFAFRDAGLDNAGYPMIQNQSGKKYQTDNNSFNSPQTIAMNSDTSGVSRYMGSSIPTINAGLSNRVDFGNFYVFCMINYYGGFKVRVPRANPADSRPLAGAGNYWKKPGDENNTDIMSLPAFNGRNSLDAYNFSDKYVVNGDYMTLGDLTLSYSLDNTKFIRQIGFRHFEVKAQASNLWTVGFNKYNYSADMGSFKKSYITPTYTLGIFTKF
jgi:TonB-linked SusC/RagA family outer membrane protein